MEPMNAALSHSKVRVTTQLSSPVFVAGEEVTGKMELDCRTDKGLGISTIMVELVAVQELISRDHSATSTFMAAQRLFQGPGLPPSNAVFAHPQPGVAPLPQHFHLARKGSTTFFFNFPLPQSSPNSINFGNGLARVFYEIRATVNIFWRGERTTVRNKQEVTVVECLVESRIPKEPFTVVAEGGKMVVQAQVVGGIGVTGQPACVELQVKNHSQKKTSSLNLTLTRTLHLPGIGKMGNDFQLTDTVVTVPFRGAEYTISPGVEGVANLVFDIPKNARGVKGGTRERTDDGDHRHIEALFDVRTSIAIVIGMGVGSKDIKIEVPLVIVHPSAVPETWNDPYAAMNAVPPQEFAYGALEPPRLPYALPPNSSGSSSPVLYPPGTMQYQHTPTPPNSFGNIPPTSPIPVYPNYYTPPIQPYFDPSSGGPAYYFPPPPMQGIDPFSAAGGIPMPPHSFGDINASFSMPNLPPAPAVANDGTIVPVEGHTEEGKGERASRISLHLRVSSRNRSASPTSHRYRITGAAPAEDPDLSNSFQMAASPLDLPVISTTAATIKQSSPEIRSPRPMPSPKASFYGAPIPAFGQNPRVAALEMMAAEEEDSQKKATEPAEEAPKRVDSPIDLAKASPKELELDAAELIEILDKTLPTPPVPSKRRLSEPVSPANPNLFTVFAASKLEKPAEPSLDIQDNSKKGIKETKDDPPVVTLANIGKRPRASTENIRNLAIPIEVDRKDAGSSLKPPNDQANILATIKQAGGLDALERRLLKEVGTRKQPDAVLNQLREMERATANAIQEKTAAKKMLGVEPHRKPTDGSVAATFTPSDDKDAAIHVLLNRKRRKTFDQEPQHQDPSGDASSQKNPSMQEEEALRLRKAAKGRVAAWLGHAQQADPPPPSETRIVEQAILDDVAAVTTTTATAKEQMDAIPRPDTEVQTAVEQPSSDAAAKQRVDPSKIQLPGRRSSGFLPISRLNVQPSPVTAQVQTALEKALAQPARVNPGLLPFNRANYGNYDVRSARGGRGGVVTSVAAIWAEKAKVDGSSPPPPTNGQKERIPLPASKKETLANLRLRSPPLEDSSRSQPQTKAQNMAQKLPKPPAARPDPPLESIKETEATSAPTPWFKVAITAARSTPGYLGIKSTSVPAKLSSSIATPTLSSTASLARPPRQPQPEYPPKAPNPLSSVPSEATKQTLDGVKATKLSIPTSAANPTNLGGTTSPTSPSDPTNSANPRHEQRKVTPRAMPTVSIGQGRLKDLIAKYQGAGANAN